MSNESTSVTYGTIPVDGLNIAYREAGNPANPKLVLLHGFPSSSHQYRDLVRALADRFHVIAPDYPGFGLSDTPDPATFAYTFDRIADVIERFLAIKGFGKYGLFVQDYGGPVGFRLVDRQPERLEWLIIQNSNAYEVGFTAAWDGLRNALWKKRSPETEQPLLGFLTRDTVKMIYAHALASRSYQPPPCLPTEDVPPHRARVGHKRLVVERPVGDHERNRLRVDLDQHVICRDRASARVARRARRRGDERTRGEESGDERA